MHPRLVLLTLVSVVASMGAQHRTANFLVTAPTPQIAQQVGQWAEHYRREKAQQWLGYEMPTWPQPCPLLVKVMPYEPPQGKTSFTYNYNQVVSMDMDIQGPLDRLLQSVLPHEITHTVFAHRFRCAVPRWADEGGSVLSEDKAERDRHDKMTRNILNHRQGFRLRTLMNMRDYPESGEGVAWLYAQGFSLSDYLVKRSNNRTFLEFVALGMRSDGRGFQNWDQAVQTYFGHRNVEELEEAWLAHLRETKNGNNVQLAQNIRPNVDANRPRTIVRTTLPPAQPVDPMPVYRGAAPSNDQASRRFGDQVIGAVTPPIYVPTPPPSSNWQPATVQLGQPQYGQPQYTPQYVVPQSQCNGPQCRQQPVYGQPR